MRAVPIGLQSPKTEQFYRYAVADKVLQGGKIKYMLFFDADESYYGEPQEGGVWGMKVFETKNGFHAISGYSGDALDKRIWYEEWKHCYPKSDYQMNNISWLAPHSKKELDFILKICYPAEPLSCKYYRDKAVVESF